ncbi:BTAD domain-containing putative transcriptional regulator [Afipia sp. GAS231]|uniref:BTAD domain-containing putative transcriptional regulator n=1 Tax=Afipia sp. GAS231 TaxID=1882747 RepID=UPI00087DDE3B|nr:BTAD domain-containing putative transcriptional regulator [Afipia sp. GAS231]SDM85137.1 TolB amino-terminal domain-containing protein [Afipia sp. GAS231]
MTLPVMRLRLLGRFGVTAPDSESTSIQLPTRKTGAVLAYLGMSRDYAASREELAALLWGGCTDQQARQSLRQALALLRKELAPDVFITDTKIVRLDPASWSIDAREFATFACAQSAEELARAARFFTGDFLSGFILEEEAFEEWVGGQRTHLQHAAAQLCETFVRRPDLVIDPNQALAAIDQLMALDPLREDWHRLAIALYARYRGKNEALSRASAFAGLLQRELGVTPERETRMMLENLRSADVADWVNGPLQDAQHSTNLSPAESNPDASAFAPATTPVAAPRRNFLTPRLDGMTLAALALAGILVAAGTFASESLHTILRLGPASSFQSPAALGALPDPWRSPAVAHEAQLPKGITPIVVLPFASLGGNDEPGQLIADMLTDDLTNTLSRIPSFRVISRQTAHSYQNQAIDVAKLGTELQVRYVLEGSVRLQDDNLRVNVELINPVTRLSVWSGRVERRGADRQGVRDEIVSRLARELQFEVLPIESQRLSNDFDADALAYRGWAALSQVNLEGYKQALALFNKALERDPNTLSAQVGIGAYHARMGAQVLDTDPAGHRNKAEAILRQVLVRDPESSQAHFYLALALNRLPTLPEALQHLERAIRIDPSDASAHAQIGNGLIRSGKVSEGLEHVRYAMLLSPRDPIMPVWLEFAGNAELELGDYREAIALFDRSIAINPGYPRSWAGLVAAYALANEPAEARRFAAQLKTFAPNLENDDMPRQFGRSENSKLHEGLMLAFGSPER